MLLSIFRTLNRALSFLEALALLLAGLYAGYALWDNRQLYASAEQLQVELLKLKPETGTENEAPLSFGSLKEMNSDVCAWLTLDNTRIDTAVVQGTDNLRYLNTDIQGNYSLSGSIFLDYRCCNNFSQPYSLLYGHHMDGGRMFGDLDRYRDERFFSENAAGTLLLPEGEYRLEIFACLLVSASEERIFDPRLSGADVSALLDFAKENALLLRESTLSALAAADETPRILALSTCAGDFTDARTVLLTYIESETMETTANEKAK